MTQLLEALNYGPKLQITSFASMGQLHADF